MNICPLCVEEQADPKHKNFRDFDKRNYSQIPCPEHGDPRICNPGNKDALEIYQYLNGNHILREFQQGDRVIGKLFVDMGLALHFCEVWGVENIPETLDKLLVIHKELYPQ